MAAVIIVIKELQIRFILRPSPAPPAPRARSGGHADVARAQELGLLSSASTRQREGGCAPEVSRRAYT